MFKITPDMSIDRLRDELTDRAWYIQRLLQSDVLTDPDHSRIAIWVESARRVATDSAHIADEVMRREGVPLVQSSTNV